FSLSLCLYRPFLRHPFLLFFLFLFNDTPPTEIYTLSLHDALPIYAGSDLERGGPDRRTRRRAFGERCRESTRRHGGGQAPRPAPSHRLQGRRRRGGPYRPGT